MDISLPAAVVMSLAVVLVIGLTIYKNRNDQKELEQQLNEDYHKPRVHHDEVGEVDEHT